MADILLIKTSSLGDVIHQMPALTEARRHLPRSRFTWVVEEAFAPLARLHPAADRVIPVASRRWRRTPLSPATWREVAAFRQMLREHGYDAIIDTQGLFRTGLIAGMARGTRHGYDSASVRERAASWFYDKRYRVDRQLHAIERNRALTGFALGYVPRFPPDYGLRAVVAPEFGDDYAVLLHATARASKEWPEDDWISLGKAMAARGLRIVLPWGNQREHDRSVRLASAIPGARIPAREPLDTVARLMAGARVVVGVDTGLLHLAAALDVPVVAIFVDSIPALTGPVSSAPFAIVGSDGAPPSLSDVMAALDKVEAASA
jgi:heptosyltransferase-1